MSRCRPSSPARNTPSSPSSTPTRRSTRSTRPRARWRSSPRPSPSFGYDDCPGHPVWIEPREWLGAEEKTAEHPLHLLSFQPATRLHGQLDPGRVAAADKIQGREPVLMHPGGRRARAACADGDVARIFNARGACLAGVRLDDGLLRGVVSMATGAWYDPATPGDPDALCVHGNPNVLTADIGTSRLGQGPSAQSCLVQIERWTRRPAAGDARTCRRRSRRGSRHRVILRRRALAAAAAGVALALPPRPALRPDPPQRPRTRCPCR